MSPKKKTKKVVKEPMKDMMFPGPMGRGMMGVGPPPMGMPPVPPMGKPPGAPARKTRKKSKKPKKV